MDTASAATIIGQIVGDELMSEICDALGGQTAYIPRQPPDFARDHRVCLEFNEVIHTAASAGRAYAIVGKMENLSPRTVQRIISGN